MRASNNRLSDVVIRDEMYRHGGLFSVTSKILVNDLLSELANVPVLTFS